MGKRIKNGNMRSSQASLHRIFFLSTKIFQPIPSPMEIIDGSVICMAHNQGWNLGSKGWDRGILQSQMTPVTLVVATMFWDSRRYRFSLLYRVLGRGKSLWE